LLLRVKVDRNHDGRVDERNPVRWGAIPMATARQMRCGRRVHQHRGNRAKCPRRHPCTASMTGCRLRAVSTSEVIGS
jgi:hypothetical protein